jgi:ubiquinone/menaquinone biosynthesis C-methylase UbiE
VLVWLFTFGRERQFRERILRPAQLKPGEVVLDVGCGTGTTALLAKQLVGPRGRVEGVDASPEMVARAQAKAEKSGIEVSFATAIAQSLPYPEAQFDVVLSTLMFHHLPRIARRDFTKEAHRVLKPGGRVLVVDFARPAVRKSFLTLHRHGHVDMQAVAKDVAQSGFRIVAQGELGRKSLGFLVASRAEE